MKQLNIPSPPPPACHSLAWTEWKKSISPLPPPPSPPPPLPPHPLSCTGIYRILRSPATLWAGTNSYRPGGPGEWPSSLRRLCSVYGAGAECTGLASWGSLASSTACSHSRTGGQLGAWVLPHHVARSQSFSGWTVSAPDELRPWWNRGSENQWLLLLFETVDAFFMQFLVPAPYPGPYPTPRKYVFDVTSVGQRSSPWTRKPS